MAASSEIVETTKITDNSDVIIPPPDLKLIIETTAQYVAKKGYSLEKQIGERQTQNRKFDFLRPANPYNAFYKQKVAELRGELNAEADEPGESEAENDAADEEKSEGKSDEPKKNAPKTSGEEPKGTAETSKKGQEKTKSGGKDGKNEKGEEPPEPKKPLLERLKAIVETATQPTEAHVRDRKEPNFLVAAPPEVVPLDVEIIKMTAQFVAANGRSFLATVSNREQKNPQFAFLKPTNASLFLFFSDLVQAYQRVFKASGETLKSMAEEKEDRKLIFDRLLGIAEYDRREKRKDELARKTLEDEKREMLLIDWHSFVILETIDFDDADDEYLPPPSMTIEEINETLEAEKRLEKNVQKVGNTIEEVRPEKTEESSDEDVDMDVDEDEVEPPAASSSYIVDKEKIPALETTQERLRRQEEQKAPVQKQKSSKVQKCTVCGQHIPVDEIEEHIRVELLDPKWRQQREIAQSKMRDSTLADSFEMAKNIANFVESQKRRPFEKAKAEEDQSIIWSHQQQAPTVAYNPQKRARIVPPAARGAVVPERMRMPMQPPVQVTGARPPVAMPGAIPTNAPQHSIGMPQRIPAGMAPPGRPMVPGGIFPGMIPQRMMSMRPSAFPAPMMPQRPPGRDFGASSLGMMRNFAPRPGMPFPQRVPFPHQGPGARLMPSPMPAMPMMPPHPPMAQPSAPSAPATVRPPVGVRTAVERGPLDKSQLTGLAGSSNLVEEKKFLSTHSKHVALSVEVPRDESKAEWNFSGQTVRLNLTLADSIAQLKEQLAKKLNGMPPKKMKVKVKGGQFLKDGFSLAYYNLTSSSVLEVGIKSRGGRK